MRTRWPPESRAGAISNCLPFAGGSSEFTLIAAIAALLLMTCPVE